MQLRFSVSWIRRIFQSRRTGSLVFSCFAVSLGFFFISAFICFRMDRGGPGEPDPGFLAGTESGTVAGRSLARRNSRPSALKVIPVFTLISFHVWPASLSANAMARAATVACFGMLQR